MEELQMSKNDTLCSISCSKLQNHEWDANTAAKLHPNYTRIAHKHIPTVCNHALNNVNTTTLKEKTRP